MVQRHRTTQRPNGTGALVLSIATVGTLASAVSLGAHRKDFARYKALVEDARQDTPHPGLLVAQDTVAATAGFMLLFGAILFIRRIRAKIAKRRIAVEREERRQQRFERRREKRAQKAAEREARRATPTPPKPRRTPRPEPEAEAQATPKKKRARRAPDQGQKEKTKAKKRGNGRKQQLYDALEPILNGLTGKVVRVAVKLLEEAEIQAVIQKPASLAALIHNRIGDFEEALRAEGVTVSNVLQAFLREATPPKGTKLPEVRVQELSEEDRRELSRIKRGLLVLSGLGEQRGMKVSILLRGLRQAGFETRVADGKGGMGHPILFYGDEIVRSEDGRARYVPHKKGGGVLEIVLTEVVKTAKAHLEARKAELQQEQAAG